MSGSGSMLELRGDDESRWSDDEEMKSGRPLLSSTTAARPTRRELALDQVHSATHSSSPRTRTAPRRLSHLRHLLHLLRLANNLASLPHLAPRAALGTS